MTGRLTGNNTDPLNYPPCIFWRMKSRDCRHVLSIGIMLILLAGIAPVSASAYIQVHTTPSGAWVCLDGWNCNYATTIFSVEPWTTHTISAYIDGYQFVSKTVKAPGDVSTLDEPLQLNPSPSETGRLYLQSSPSGAECWVDSRYYGTTPQTIGGLSPGTHSVLLRSGGYSDHMANVLIYADETSNYNGGLTPDAGAGILQVDSQPGGAAIYLDGDYQGMTPMGGGVTFIRDIIPGSYALSLLMPDYQTYTSTVTIENGIINDIHVTLEPTSPGPSPDTTGQITIQSAPAGANVYLDNQYKGITPMYLSDISAGTHSILFRLDGYEDYRATVNVEGGSTTDVSDTLVMTSRPTTAPTTAKAVLFWPTALVAIGICCAVLVVKTERK